MCECGCVSNDKHYRFSGPGKTFYILTLSGCCLSCDAPSGICVRHIKPGEFLHEWYSDPEKLDGELSFENWGDGSGGAAVVIGMLRSEFIESTKSHLIGIDPKDFADNDGLIDGIGAEAILEEMYEDAQKKPELVVPVKSGGER
jgi:hypothetical protein